MIQLSDTLGQIAVSHPQATQIFLKHRLDFCCGGRQRFGEACERAGLDPHRIIDEITAQNQAIPADRWQTEPLAKLVEFIVTRYHDSLRQELPPLLDAARKVERVHASKTSCPHGLSAELQQLHNELLHHLSKEEQVLFPAIRAAHRGPQIQMPIRVMMQEHDDHGASLERLRALTTEFNPPTEACATWRALYQGLAKLETDLIEHIHLENNILFPRALDS